MSDMSMILS